MAQDERGLEDEIAVSAVDVIVDYYNTFERQG